MSAATTIMDETTTAFATQGPGLFNKVWAPGAVVGLVAVLLIAATALSYGAYTWIYKRCRRRRYQPTTTTPTANYDMQLDDDNDISSFDDASTCVSLDDVVVNDRNTLDF